MSPASNTIALLIPLVDIQIIRRTVRCHPNPRYGWPLQLIRHEKGKGLQLTISTKLQPRLLQWTTFRHERIRVCTDPCLSRGQELVKQASAVKRLYPSLPTVIYLDAELAEPFQTEVCSSAPHFYQLCSSSDAICALLATPRVIWLMLPLF